MSGFAKDIPMHVESISVSDSGYQPAVNLSREVTSLFMPLQNFSPEQDNASYLDVPPPPLPGVDTGASNLAPSLPSADTSAPSDLPAPPLPGIGSASESQGSENTDGGDADGGTSDEPAGLDPNLTIEQLIANGTIQASLPVRAEALYDENKSRIEALFNFFGAEELFAGIDNVIQGSEQWITGDQLNDPSQLTISIASDVADANFIINADGTVVCNRPPLLDQSELTIAMGNGLFGVTDAQRASLDEFTRYLIGSLSNENESGEMISPVIDPSIELVLTPEQIDTDDSAASNTNYGDNSGGGGSGSGGGGSGGGGSGGGGGDTGGGGGGSYEAPSHDGGYVAPDNSSTSGLNVDLPTDQYVLPDDTSQLNLLKATDAIINGNGIGADRYTAVSGPNDNGYGVGAYNANAETFANWVYNLSDDDLEAIEAGQCTADCPAANSAKNEKGDGKGKGGSTGRPQHHHTYPAGTAERLRALRAELTNAHGSKSGPLTADDLTTLFSQHQSGSSTDGLVNMLEHMSNDPPVDASIVQADVAANFDPSLQERMANDLLTEYGLTYIENHPEVDLSDPQQLRNAAGTLMLAMNLGHYPSEEEIASDSNNPEGVINRTNAEVSPPPQASDLGAADLGLNPNNSVDLVVAHVMGHEGGLTSINFNDNGHGISLGIFQWNQGNPEAGAGGLGDFLLRVERKHPGLVPAEILYAVRDHAAQNSEFVAMDLTQPPYREQIEAMVDNPLFADVQIDAARDKVAACADIARELGLTSVGGVMLVTDMVNQMGTGSARRYVLDVALNVQGEQEKINAIMQQLSASKYQRYYDFYAGLVSEMQAAQNFSTPFS